MLLDIENVVLPQERLSVFDEGLNVGVHWDIGPVDELLSPYLGYLLTDGMH